ncbi:PaaI family thioesterase [Glacieibacterium frigidum]|uniref:PaaI family thioesterase n=1 Tax=Glacieibacterium frigidum TaxID=2593303 RepID=A0A552U7C2_9SPHN|nr:PaaI family thioesterase [Glacieibacterium frigidum]TRW14111.1 PaaI family thioesterase [Glacieibacterium frigidum]
MTDAELMERMNRVAPPTSRLLGTQIIGVDSAAGTVRMSFAPKPEFCNPMGNVQGGFIVAMLDDCAAVSAVVASGKRIVVPTIELKCSFFGVVRLGPVFGLGRCLKIGKRVAFMEAELTDADGRVLAKLSTSALPVPMPDDANLVEA